ncbi:hypothetical protein [Dongia deserti]|uniref:hypothetical protein n=1 Tax=Dongia deserti TaxID=2268030 RepID=UPI000E64890D|nr:hypothetical protein [Dongia deserti]
MIEHTQSLEGDAGVGDILVKIRGRHYLIPAEAIGSPLEDSGSEVLGMLEKELSTLEATSDSRMIGVDFVMELGGSDDRNARAITDDRSARQCVEPTRSARQCVEPTRSARQCVEPTRSARQCVEPTRSARQCVEPTRSARQCVEPTRSARQCVEPTRSARQCVEPTRSARQCVEPTRSARAIHPQAA